MNRFIDEDTEGPKSEAVRAPETVVSVGRAFHQCDTVRLIADTGSDWSPEVVSRLGIEVLPFSYVTPEGVRTEDLWQTQTPQEFYDVLRKNPDLHYSTSAITPGRYEQVFRRYAEEGVPTIYVGMTQGLSSAILNAQAAADIVRQDYPDFELYVLDDKCPSVCGELLCIEMMQQASRGLSAREVYEWALEARFFVHGYFMLDNLRTLAAGGRIPPAAATVGSKLDIKPELSFDTGGALTFKGMCRGRRKALRAILAEFVENYSHDTSLPLAIVTADADRDADWLEREVRRQDGCGEVLIIRSQILPILGSHVGPGMVGLAFWGGDRREKLSFTDKLARRVRRDAKESDDE